MERLAWKLVETETELWKSPPDEILQSVAKLVFADSPQWTGSPTELKESLGTELKPNSPTRNLNVNASYMETEYSIHYENKTQHEGRRITLTWIGKKE